MGALAVFLPSSKNNIVMTASRVRQLGAQLARCYHHSAVFRVHLSTIDLRLNHTDSIAPFHQHLAEFPSRSKIHKIRVLLYLDA